MAIAICARAWRRPGGAGLGPSSRELAAGIAVGVMVFALCVRLTIAASGYLYGVEVHHVPRGTVTLVTRSLHTRGVSGITMLSMRLVASFWEPGGVGASDIPVLSCRRTW